jgi:hypothetical protein
LRGCLSKNDIRKFFVVKSATAIAIVDSEELFKIALIDYHSHLCDGLLECAEVNLTSVGEIKELEALNEELLL